MSIFSSYKKIFLLGFVIAILIAIPFSVYVAQKRQQTTSKAAASTTLSFDPASLAIKAGGTLTLNVVLDPGTGATANQVSFVKLVISFDSSKFTTVSDSLGPNPNPPNTLTSILEDPVYTSETASISLSIGADPTRVVTTKTKIAVLKLQALSQTDNNNPTSITFGKNTQVLSIASSDQTSENVLSLSTTTPALITINPAPSAPSSVSTPASPTAPTPTLTPSSFPTTQQPLVTTGTTTAELAPTIAPQVPQALPQPPEVTLPPTGPGENILVIGIIGAILTLIGGALFILL